MPARLFADEGAPPLLRRERRPVSLSAVGTRPDGSTVEMTVVDLSPDGCGVLCSGALFAGERLNVAVLRRGSTGAVVRWAANGRAGLSFAPREAPESAHETLRRHERVNVSAEVAMRRAGKLHFRVRIYDLSPEGCKAEFVERPDLGEQLWIKFDGMEALEASVRWIAGQKAGLMFARPIHAAVFDLLAARLCAGG